MNASMTIEALRDYGNWIGNSPSEIRDQVIRHGGWSRVFPNNKERIKKSETSKKKYKEFQIKTRKTNIVDLNLLP